VLGGGEYGTIPSDNVQVGVVTTSACETHSLHTSIQQTRSRPGSWLDTRLPVILEAYCTVLQLARIKLTVCYSGVCTSLLYEYSAVRECPRYAKEQTGTWEVNVLAVPQAVKSAPLRHAVGCACWLFVFPRHATLMCDRCPQTSMSSCAGLPRE